MPLQIKISEKDDVAVVFLSGSIDALSLSDLDIGFNRTIQTGKKKILLNMKGLTFLNSRAIGALISFNKWVKKVGGNLKIAEIPPNILQVFKMVRLDALIPMYPLSKEALESFNSPQQ